MSYTFQTSANREASNAEKYTLREQLFGTQDVLPAWVADMDIDTPSFVLDGVKKRLKHPIVGYEEVPDSAFDAQREWFMRRHGVEYEREDMFFSHSVVASMQVAIRALSEVGDEVIVQTPIYPPFFNSVKHLGRKVLKNPLKRGDDGRYRFDIEHLKNSITPKTKLLLLCSPHNPVGRVWKKDELEELFGLCKEHEIFIFSDEIHCDLVYGANRHIPSATIEGMQERIITAIGVGKTFNMAGFAMSSVVVPKPLRAVFKKAYNDVHFVQGNVLSHVAFEAAYRQGDAWVDALLKHLHNNYTALQEVCERHAKKVKLTPIEATYLAWIDCTQMGLSNKELREFFVRECKLGLNAGVSFGLEGSGFMRLNFGVSSDTMAQILQRLDEGLTNGN